MNFDVFKLEMLHLETYHCYIKAVSWGALPRCVWLWGVIMWLVINIIREEDYDNIPSYIMC